MLGIPGCATRRESAAPLRDLRRVIEARIQRRTAKRRVAESSKVKQGQARSSKVKQGQARSYRLNKELDTMFFHPQNFMVARRDGENSA
jgi:hypothetical protein